MDIGEIIKDVLVTLDEVELKLTNSGPSEQSTMILGIVNKFSTLASTINNHENEQISLEEYNEKLNMLLASYENQDYDLMVSVLQMEIKPLLEYWLDNLSN